MAHSLSYWFIFGPCTKLPFGICSIYFDLTLVFQIPCQEVWKDPLRAEPQEVFGGFKHQLTRYLGSTRVKVSKYLVHNLQVLKIPSLFRTPWDPTRFFSVASTSRAPFYREKEANLNLDRWQVEASVAQCLMSIYRFINGNLNGNMHNYIDIHTV